MKKIMLFLLPAMLFSASCDTLKSLGNILSEVDAANAIKEALIIGSDFGANSLGQHGSFSSDVLLNAILPQGASQVIQTLNKLGLASEFNRFTNTLDNAAVDAVTRSGPVFVNSIRKMSIRDAIGIVKNGGTAATDYLRRTAGDSLQKTVTPIMYTALQEYKVADQWNSLVAPVKLLLGNKAGLNLNLDHILAVMIVNNMFQKIEQKEIAIRTDANARTTASLQRVFGKNWNTTTN
ncbi:MAG: DUF4197 domain-containing protein [Bacteroidota bacterium]|nr:DUF4197 domain-containing protein [Bacteroidota bacterium]